MPKEFQDAIYDQLNEPNKRKFVIALSLLLSNLEEFDANRHFKRYVRIGFD